MVIAKVIMPGPMSAQNVGPIDKIIAAAAIASGIEIATIIRIAKAAIPRPARKKVRKLSPASLRLVIISSVIVLKSVFEFDIVVSPCDCSVKSERLTYTKHRHISL